MALADNVSIVALVVSLVALIIALGQFTQQILGTAEGYRRCSSLVVGPWARLRWRHWVWTEFRYETHFVCPELTLSAVGDESRPELCITNQTLEPKTNPIPSKRWWIKFTRRSRVDVAGAMRGVLGSSLYPNTIIKKEERLIEKDQSSSDDPEQASAGDITQPTEATPLLQKDNKTSWLVLLPRAREVYGQYKAQCKPQTQYLSSLPSQVGRDTGMRNPIESLNFVATAPHVSFREWVWDTMPDDVTKPLATTTLGFITVLAMRMGMQWRFTDLVKGQLLADGNGYSFSFIEVSGLGLIAKLKSTRNASTFPALIPSRAVDKLMCGIIPGSRYLVDQDFPCIGDNRKEDTFAVICRRIALNESLFKLWDEGAMKRVRETQNDAVALLSEFLPLSGYAVHKHYFWGWVPGRASVFRYYEGKYAFWRHLKTIKDRESTLDDVFKHLDYLQSHYVADSYGLNRSCAAEAKDGKSEKERLQKQVDLQQDCRAIFDWTTQWFISHDFHQRESGGTSGRTKYTHLVAAHCRMSIHALGTAWHKAQENWNSAGWGDPMKRKKYELDNEEYGIPVKYDFFNAHMFEVGKAYIAHVGDRGHGLAEYMRKTDFDIDEELVLYAWWVLMLRGIVWSMPTAEEHPGEGVPSSFYDNDTPIWIA